MKYKRILLTLNLFYISIKLSTYTRLADRKMCFASYYFGRIKNIDMAKIAAEMVMIYTTAGRTYLWSLLFWIKLSSNILSSNVTFFKINEPCANFLFCV